MDIMDALSASDLSHLTEEEELNLRLSTSHSLHLINKMNMSGGGGILPEEHVVIHTDDADEDSDNDDFFAERSEDLDMLLSTYTLHSCLHSRLCIVVFYLCTFLLLLASTIALIVVLVMIVLPYYKVQNFVPTTCVVVDVSWYSERSQCSCGKGCSSDYPCLLIKVLTDPHSNRTAVLYEHESLLDAQVTNYLFIKINGIFICPYICI